VGSVAQKREGAKSAETGRANRKTVALFSPRAKGFSLCPLACVVSFDYFAKYMTEDKQIYYGSQV
jgi:hypothetical protein